MQKMHKIFVLSWLFTLLIATVGISVEQIYCYCMGNTKIALFPGESGCCKPQKTCCKKNQKHRNCTHKTVKVHQLKTEAVSTPVEFKFFCSPFLLPEPLPSLAVGTVDCQHTALHLPDFALPPPISGRIRCIKHQQFLC